MVSSINYMDKRCGDYLKNINPKHFMEVYKRVQAGAREEYQQLQDRVEYLESCIKISKKAEAKGYPLQPFEKNYPQDLARAKEHLERFIAVNADYLI